MEKRASLQKDMVFKMEEMEMKVFQLIQKKRS